jgi:hypothetical protein
MGWFFRFALLRLQARWRSLATLIIGVLLAAFIGANASLYTTAIAQVGMVQFLTSQSSTDTNILSRSSLSPIESEDFAASWAELDSLFAAEFSEHLSNLHSWTGDYFRYAETQPLIPILDGEDLVRTRVRVAYYDALANQAELIEGVWPGDNPDIIEVVLGFDVAQLMGISVGDVLSLDQRGWDTSVIFEVRIVGLISPIDVAVPYWFEPSPLRTDPGAGFELEANLLTTRASLEMLAPAYLPQPPVQIGWRIAPDHRQLPFSRIDETLHTLSVFGDELNRSILTGDSSQANFVYSTNLPSLLTDYAQEIVYLNVPFGLLLLQLAALVLFFLVLIAALVRRGERREIALLQSRGATDTQIIVARSIETIVICLIVSLIAPFIAQKSLEWFIPVFTGIEQIPLELSLQVFAYSGGAALLAFLMLMLTLFPVLRLPLISAGGSGSRSESQTWWQRYYLDVVLLIVGMAALFQLTRSQSAIATSATGRVQADPLLLLAPTLLFVAFSSVLLRFFPHLMNLIAGYFSRRRSIEGALASWQLSREPLHYGRIAFLLALAIGLGWFAISYQSTLLGNQSDQAAYLVGGDVRLVYDEPDSPETIASMERIANLPDVASSSQVTRINVPSIATGGGRRSRQAGDILVIDTNSINEVVFWRNDLGSLEMPPVPFDINAETGLPIPEGAARLGFWAYLEGTQFISFGEYTEELRPFPLPLTNEITFGMRFSDSDGELVFIRPVAHTEDIFVYIEELGEEFNPYQAEDTDNDGLPDTVPSYSWPNEGWLYFELDLSEFPASRFLAFDIYLQPDTVLNFMRLTIADIQFIAADGSTSASEFAQGNWDIVRGFNAAAPGEYAINPDIPEVYGAEGIVMEWLGDSFTNNNNGSSFSLLLEYPESASITIAGGDTGQALEEDDIVGIPALVSRSFIELNEFTEGQRFSLFVNNVAPWFELSRSIEYYPTLYQERPYLVVDRALLNYTLIRGVNSRINPNELWLRLGNGVDEAAFIASVQNSADAPLIKEIFGLEATLDAYETDVLSLGVIGLLYISFTVGLVLSIVSLLNYISLTVQARIGEFAVLRAMGLTTSRMVWSIMIEQFLVLFAAVILGALIGQFLTSQVLPPLALSAAGGIVTPPFALRLDVATIVQYLLILLAVLLVVLLLSALWVRRTATAEALRLTED